MRSEDGGGCRPRSWPQRRDGWPVSGLHSILYSLSGIAALIVCCGVATAEPFPSRPVKIVIPYPISGPTDIRGTSRMSRSYRLMAPHAPPAITDTLARIAE